MVMNPKELSHLIHRVFRTVVNPEIRISEYPIPLGKAGRGITDLSAGYGHFKGLRSRNVTAFMDVSRLMRIVHDPVSGMLLDLPAGLIFQSGADF